MKKFIEKFNKYKTLLSGKINIPEVDKIKHYIVCRLFVPPIALFGMFNPLLGIIGLVTLFVGCIGWELLGLYKRKFTRVQIKESIGDLVMAFFAIFVPLVLLIYMRSMGL